MQDASTSTQGPPEHPRNLGEGFATDSELHSAATAVRIEHRATSRQVRLRCHQVSPRGNEDDGIFALEVDRFAELDWTWEGAKAARTLDFDEEADRRHPYTWSGEVVEVDDTANRVYVKVKPERTRPCVGHFTITPYQFLAALHELYNGGLSSTVKPPLSQGLMAATGNLRVRMLPRDGALPHLDEAWSRSWGYLWGPPGTGKTRNIGQQVAAALADESERILVLSTTNKATDEVAISIGRAMQTQGIRVSRETVCRVGPGADYERFRKSELEELLVGGEAWLHRNVSRLTREHASETNPEKRAKLWAAIQKYRSLLSTGRPSIANVSSRVVVATAFVGMRDLATAESTERAQRGVATFTSVIMDEAGLVARAAVAALALHSARRVFLVGDPKQLSPATRISRILPSCQAKWLASSGLSHLSPETPGTHLLRRQHRMHPDIGNAVSKFQYQAKLENAPTVAERPCPLDPPITDENRAIWYVLDEDAEEIAHIRAERGPGNRSWIRKRSPLVVARLFQAYPSTRSAQGLFVTPFVAQARAMAGFFGYHAVNSWTASSTHRQQGTEADVVIFDTVNASSTGWGHDDWKRLINVGISRARHLLVVLASRAEMQEPYLAPLTDVLKPCVIRRVNGLMRWTDVPRTVGAHKDIRKTASHTLGAQIDKRRAMRPVLSAEQQRLCNLAMDGKPRLVRGVAGSGKTFVLTHWLVRRLVEDDGEGRYWVLYANAALRGLLSQMINRAWAQLKHSPCPWERIELLHVKMLLEQLELEAGIAGKWPKPFDLESHAHALLAKSFEPRCQALFIDEAQDFGEATLELVVRLVEPSSQEDSRARPVSIFYDNAQNVYQRGAPRWSRLGLDMRGRSTVMKDSFRSTRPIVELALNTLYRLKPPAQDQDHIELVKRDLLEKETRNERPWWCVRFNRIEGPPPEFRYFEDRTAEVAALGELVMLWIRNEGVRPGDIRIVANSPAVRKRIVKDVGARMAGVGACIAEVKGKPFEKDDNLIVVTTAHSLKGYESEVVIVAGADKFVAKMDDDANDKNAEKRRPLPAALYVAMTRARSLLYVSAIKRAAGSPGAQVVNALQQSLEDLRSVPEQTSLCSHAEEQQEILQRIGPEHRDWLRALDARCTTRIDPICRRDGSIIAEPVFWFQFMEQRFACFSVAPSNFVSDELEDVGFRSLLPGTPFTS